MMVGSSAGWCGFKSAIRALLIFRSSLCMTVMMKLYPFYKHLTGRARSASLVLGCASGMLLVVPNGYICGGGCQVESHDFYGGNCAFACGNMLCYHVSSNMA